MKEKVAVATVQGRAYFLIVNALREQDIDFVSLVPGQTISPKIKVAITTEKEKSKLTNEKILIFNGEDELQSLIIEVKKLLLGKEIYEKIVVGIDPGEITGLAVLADGKVIEEGNCYSSHELTSIIIKVLKTVNFALTSVEIKIGNGVPVHKELLEDLDQALPPMVVLEVVSEAGTNRPLKAHSRKIRHISSAIRIAGRNGLKFTRRKAIASNSTTQ